jgi:hypothetical protein
MWKRRMPSAPWRSQTIGINVVHMKNGKAIVNIFVDGAPRSTINTDYHLSVNQALLMVAANNILNEEPYETSQ